MTTSLTDRNGNLLVDPNLDIPRDSYQQVSSINKFGRNPAIAIGVEEEIWDGSAAYPFPSIAAGAVMTKINTTADVVGMRGETVEIQGLDVDWNLTVQNAILDATNTTTLVVLTTPLRRVFRMKFLSSVVGTSSITLVNDADDTLYGNIEPGNNQTLMAIYTVPAGKTAYMTCYYAHVNPGVNLDPTSLPIKLYARDNAAGHAAQLKHVVGQTSDGFQHFFTPYTKYTEKTDLYITGTPVGKAADVAAGFDLIVVDNDRNW